MSKRRVHTAGAKDFLVDSAMAWAQVVNRGSWAWFSTREAGAMLILAGDSGWLHSELRGVGNTVAPSLRERKLFSRQLHIRQMRAAIYPRVSTLDQQPQISCRS